MSICSSSNSCKQCVSLHRWKCKKELSNNLFSKTSLMLRLNRRTRKTRDFNNNWRWFNSGMNQHRKPRIILNLYILNSKSTWNRQCDRAIRALKMQRRRTKIRWASNRLIMKRSGRKWWVWRRRISTSKATARCSSSSWSWKMCSWWSLRSSLRHNAPRCNKKSISRLLRRAWRASRTSWTKVEELA